jgi:HPt (histidine-containing phosphotransfer) domain-containing protein
MNNVYDHDGTMRRMGGDAELFQEMVELLKTDAPRHLAVAWRSFREQDWTTLGRAAHTLKGLAANFGAGRAVATAAELERMAKTGSGDSEQTLCTLAETLEELAASLPSGRAPGQQRAAHRIET